MLLLHTTGGRSFSLHAGGRAWHFVSKARRFDYFPAGTCSQVVAGPQPMRAIRVDIPVAFENSVLEEGRWAAGLSTRLQFSDRRLEALVVWLERAAGAGLAAPDAVMLSVAVVDRLYETAHSPADKSSLFTDTVKRLIVEYLDHHIGSPVDADKVAFLTGLARTQFSKIFYNSFGAPLHQYVIARKVQIATRRLLEDVRITELSHELGFSSHAHFATVFRQCVGATPSQFRREHATDSDRLSIKGPAPSA